VLMRVAGLLLVLVGLVLAGCAAGPRPDGFQPEIADESKSVVYIFREARALGGRPVGIYLNQRFVGELNPGRYLVQVVEPGEYLVRAEDGGSAVRQVQINAGDTAYFRVQAGRFGRNITVDLPETVQARRLIARTVRAPS
jgi:hypothetical protein